MLLLPFEPCFVVVVVVVAGQLSVCMCECVHAQNVVMFCDVERIFIYVHMYMYK